MVPPGHISNADSLDRQRKAYDHGYWAGFCFSKREADKPLPTYPAAPAPGRELITLDPADTNLPTGPPPAPG